MGTTRVKKIAATAAVVLALGLSGCATSTAAGDATTTTATTDATTATVTTENAADHDDATDYVWDEADEVAIELTGDSATAPAESVQVDGSTVTITAAGTYRLSGTLDDGQVLVDVAEDGVVRLVLDGVDITSSTGAALAVLEADKAVVILADGSQNGLTDAETYVFPDAETDEPNAALYSADDLTIGGSGALVVTGRYDDAIASKDGLVISGGTITVEALDDGIRGKDYLVVRGAEITVTAGGDGLKSDDADDATMGYITVEDGVVSVTAGGDGFDAETDVLVHGGDVTVASGGGAAATIAEDASAKGLKGTVSVVVDGGTLDVDAADDAVHSDGAVTVTAGTLTLATGDDAVHADGALTVSGGTITVTESYEGLEGAQITVSGGEIEIHASDDGINVAGGADGSGQMAPGNRQGGAMGGGRGGPGAAQTSSAQTTTAQTTTAQTTTAQTTATGEDTFAASADYWLEISGGTIVVHADGDGLDANGDVTMTGGTVLVHGPTSQGNGAIDVDGTFTIDGGVLLAAGSAGMAMTPTSSTSQQAFLGISFGSAVTAGSEIEIRSADGTSLTTFTPAKSAATLVVSTPDLVSGSSYEVVVAGSSLGTVTAS